MRNILDTTELYCKRCYLTDYGLDSNLPGAPLSASDLSVLLRYLGGAVETTHKVQALIRGLLPSMRYMRDMRIRIVWSERCVITETPCRCNKWSSTDTVRRTNTTVHREPWRSSRIGGGLVIPEETSVMDALKYIASDIHLDLPINSGGGIAARGDILYGDGCSVRRYH